MRVVLGTPYVLLANRYPMELFFTASIADAIADSLNVWRFVFLSFFLIYHNHSWFVRTLRTFKTQRTLRTKCLKLGTFKDHFAIFYQKL